MKTMVSFFLWRLAALSIGVLSLSATYACAQPGEPGATASVDAHDETARRLFSLATEAFDAARYAEAAGYYTQAYEVSPRPELLFNAGAAWQRGGLFVGAQTAFERLLREHPDVENRVEVEARLSAIELRLQEQSQTSDEPASSFAPWQRPMAITGLVLGGAAIAASAVFFVLGRNAQSRVEDSTQEYWVDVEASDSRARSMGVVGGLAVGVGAALIVAGVVFFSVPFGADDDDGSITLRPGVASLNLEGRW